MSDEEFWLEQEKEEESCYNRMFEEYIKTEERKKRLKRLRKYGGNDG